MSNSLVLALILVGCWGGSDAMSFPLPSGDNKPKVEVVIAPSKINPGGIKPSLPGGTIPPVPGETKPSEVIPSKVNPGEVKPDVKKNEAPNKKKIVNDGWLEGIPPTGRPKSSNCQIACPEGWVRFGSFPNCYKLPSQPAYLDTFWEHDRRCKRIEPTSYVAVMNGLAEQAFATPVAHQYAANWFALGTNGFMWLGGYTDNHGWKFLDGSNEKGNLLMTAANIIGSKRNGTCLGADPKTLGMWQTRPCSDKTGAAICEMAQRRVCGKHGSIIPVAPIHLSELKNLFPKLYSIPFIGTEYANAFKGFPVLPIK